MREGREDRATAPSGHRATGLRPQPPTASSLSSVPVAVPFTPGPWFIRPLNANIFSIRGTEKAVAYTPPVDPRGAIDLNRANARLIAAAPDMFAALEHILNGALSLPRFAEDEARAALAKAKGE